MDIDELNNLVITLKRENEEELTDSVSLNAVSGVLVVQDKLATATMTIVKTAINQQVYDGDVTPKSIPTGAGSIHVTITQLGVTIEKDLQVAGETVLDLSEDIINVTMYDGTESWTIDNVSMPVENLKFLKHSGNRTIRAVFGQWEDGTDVFSSNSFDFANDVIVDFDYSNIHIITQSCNFIVPITKQYEIVLTGGGGGGAGGSGGGVENGAIYSNDAGQGGRGGFVRAVRQNLTKNQNIPVTIGAGGKGGTGGPAVKGTNAWEDVEGDNGLPGGATIFGDISANGGNGGTSSYQLSYRESRCGDGGSGGAGSNGTNLDIYGSSVAYGTGGSGGNGEHKRVSDTGSTDGKAGTSITTEITWLSNIGRGGNGGDGGYYVGNVIGGFYSNITSAYGGKGGSGGYGFNTYGRGGNGGDGGYILNFDEAYDGAIPYAGKDGINGTSGAVALRVVL